jgi:hypothetical protein
MTVPSLAICHPLCGIVGCVPVPSAVPVGSGS